MTGNERTLAYTIVGSVLFLNAISSLILIPVMGIIGAGVAIAVSITVKRIVLVLIARKRLGMWSLPFKAMGVWVKNFKLPS